uniref:S-adenosylmethionine carrier 1, chloroplastic/mitochondrial n=1 Tax=Ananas comosus var. bracteatus TaxID=296719 RepID=A0A6V7QLK1_ANACO|nr:unnamed protein product [Ananas comosus var. bracteatus]
MHFALSLPRPSRPLLSTSILSPYFSSSSSYATEGVIAGGTAGVVVETAARGGSKIEWKGLYSGLAGNIAGVLPASAVFVGIYEPTKQKLLEIFPEKFSAVAHLKGFVYMLSYSCRILIYGSNIDCRAIGGAAASLIRVPTEVVKQRMQTGQFSSAPDAVRLILAKEGFKGLYAGYSSFLLRDLPFDAIQFCLYEQLRIGYKIAAKRELNDPENAVIGAVAGKSVVLLSAPKTAITGAITTPLDVMKTRLMVQGRANQYNGLLSCAQTILREEGPAAFLKGVGPRVLWIGIGGSIFFGVLERTKLLLSQRHSKRSISESSKEE